MAFELGVYLRDRVLAVTAWVLGGRSSTHILRDQAGNQHKRSLYGGQDICVAYYMSIYQPSSEAQVFRPGSVHLAHHSLGDLAVEVVEERLSSLQHLARWGIIDVRTTPRR